MKKFKLIFFTYLILITLLLAPNISIAQGTESFYVKPVIPENQVPDTSEYFHIQSNGQLEQTLEIVIANESSEEKNYQITILDGMTTDVGEISYDTTHTYDDSQKIKLSENIKIEKKVSVPADDSAVIPFQLNLEDNDFSGLLLGSINVIEDDNTDKKDIGVNNKFAYNIPIKVDFKTSQIVPKLAYLGIQVKKQTKGSQLMLGFSNPSAIIIRNLAISYKITSASNKNVVVDDSLTGLEVAPTSQFQPKIDLDRKALKSGSYNIEIQAESELSDIHEKWTDSFTISSKEAKEINSGLNVEASSNYWYFILPILLIIALVAYLIYKKKKSQPSKRQKKKKRKKSIK